MQTIRPSSKQIFCKPEDVVTTTSSGFLLAGNAAQSPEIAEVINVGAHVSGYRAKDRIVYKPYATTEVNIEGVEYFLISEDDVLGTVVEV